MSSAANLDLHRLARDLGGEVSGGQVLAPGPNHSKTDRSLSVRLDPGAPEGFVVHSFAEDDPLACRDHVRSTAGLPAWEPKPRSALKQGRAEYVYRQSDGSPYLKVTRTPEKAFYQAHWSGGEWVRGKPAGPKIPYRLPEMLSDPTAPVFVVEGEKDADNLARRGLVSTTASEGAGKWTDDLAQWFRGRTVYILPDNDEPGRAHARRIADTLLPVAADVRIVRLPGLKPKGDVSDWLGAGGVGLVDLCKATPPEVAPQQQAASTLEDGQPTACWAKPFRWTDPSRLPRREWLYGDHYIRKFVSATFSPGGVGKSSLALVEAMAMASGRPLLGCSPARRLKVAYWNGEDPLEETQRRAMAAAIHYGLKPADLEGWLFIGSGREAEIIVAEQTSAGATVMAPNVEKIVALVESCGLDLAVIDPFVSSHRVSENDNGAIDVVAKTWARIADRTNIGVELIHHTRKGNGAETTVEDGRGASSLLYAARSARVLNAMTREEGERAGVERHRSHFRVDNGKANLAPPPEGSQWFRMASVGLGNGAEGTEGDLIGVVTPWEWPDAFAGVSATDLAAVQARVETGQWRENIQASDWVGKAVAEALGLDLEDKRDRQKVKTLVATWLKTGALVRVMGKDASRRERPMIEVGRRAEL